MANNEGKMIKQLKLDSLPQQFFFPKKVKGMEKMQIKSNSPILLWARSDGDIKIRSY